MDLIGRGERTAETAQNVSESDVIYRNDAVMEIANHLGMPAENWIKIAEEWLRDVPSAQPERETAEFIRWMECKKTANYISYTPHCKCSKCGTEFLIETIKYCYMCGARMER